MDKLRVCKTCLRKFKPSSRHLDCPICRSLKKRHQCVACGKMVWKNSTLCLSCLGLKNRGEYNVNWTGGKHLTSQGYIVILQRDHPRAKSNGGYVFEHILKMEEKIGRYLEKGENIHHINGLRNDNRIENLELWVKPQMAGIRVEDAIKWAHEIINKYEK